MSEIARSRRAVWPDRETVRASYASRPPMNVLEPDALAAYVQYGFRDRDDGQVELGVRARGRGAVLRGGGRARGRARTRSATSPTSAVRSSSRPVTTRTCPANVFAAQAEAAGAPYLELDGSHFFPQEDTARTVALDPRAPARVSRGSVRCRAGPPVGSARWRSSSGWESRSRSAAAVRSTWSPCGQSMLSQITPFTERARHHRFGVTAGWFVVGSVVGGATLGVIAGRGRGRHVGRRPVERHRAGDPRRPRPRRRRGRRRCLRVPPAVLPAPGQRRLAAPLPRLALRRRLRLAGRRGRRHLHHDRRGVPHRRRRRAHRQPRGRVRHRRAVRLGARAHRLPHREGGHARAAGVVPSPVRRVGRADSPVGHRARARWSRRARPVWRGASSGSSRWGCRSRSSRRLCSCRRRVARVLRRARRAPTRSRPSRPSSAAPGRRRRRAAGACTTRCSWPTHADNSSGVGGSPSWSDPERHHRGNRLAPLVVGEADDDRVDDGGVVLQHLFDLFGPHLLAAGVDAARPAAEERDRLVVVHDRPVAGHRVRRAVDLAEGHRRALGILVVADRARLRRRRACLARPNRGRRRVRPR